MAEYRFLNDADFNALHRCFLDAFSDYSVNMQMSEEQFRARLVHNGVRLDLSVGAFKAAGEMVGFTINSCDFWQGKLTTYDSGTGVVPQHRGKGIAKKLFDSMLPKLREYGARQYLLEVITSNEAAVALYRKLGFRETRKLAVLSLNKELIYSPVKNQNPLQIWEIQNPDWQLFQSFADGFPSWQNSVASIERSESEKIFLGAFRNEQCVGYAVAFKSSRSILQLAVDKEYRRKGVGSALLAALQNEASSPEKGLRMSNIDYSLTDMLAFCASIGFETVLDQYEMVKDL